MADGETAEQLGKMETKMSTTTTSYLKKTCPNCGRPVASPSGNLCGPCLMGRPVAAQPAQPKAEREIAREQFYRDLAEDIRSSTARIEVARVSDKFEARWHARITGVAWTSPWLVGRTEEDARKAAGEHFRSFLEEEIREACGSR